MVINGKVHCMFEQSGTFKNEFKKLGYEAYDYDIQNNFNETDYVIDLFAEIEKSYGGGTSMFDNITPADYCSSTVTIRALRGKSSCASNQPQQPSP